ncbi:FYVE-type zinc finger-containing protein [Reticulomyxa filosa]|uniref:FYVE-type zinc finger-containing protein n=1 Tax=Reticulomyxa filosa TaxID=46433 RepID=X6MR42_RETFI|nr:FYVE-type zinc finger-containing protein [Reticulomyxa filosa]|eukprot:ETO16324.1 FYVE-type zinc finger-containing protein [Reticulomyxa filosa]
MEGNIEPGNHLLLSQTQMQPQLSNGSAAMGSSPSTPGSPVGSPPIVTFNSNTKPKSVLKLNVERTDLPEDLEFTVDFGNMFADPKVVLQVTLTEESRSNLHINASLRSNPVSRRSSLNNIKKYAFDEKDQDKDKDKDKDRDKDRDKNKAKDKDTDNALIAGNKLVIAASPLDDSDQSFIHNSQDSLSYSSSPSQGEENVELTPQPPDMLTLNFREEKESPVVNNDTSNGHTNSRSTKTNDNSSNNLSTMNTTNNANSNTTTTTTATTTTTTTAATTTTNNNNSINILRKEKEEIKTSEFENQDSEERSGITDQTIPDVRRLVQEAAFLKDPYRGNFGLLLCFNNQTVPVYQNEPSSLIAYTLSSLEYNCRLAHVKSEEIRSCLERKVPTFEELQNKFEGKKKTPKTKEWTADDEIDLEDLLYHLPKIPNTSKLEFLNNRDEYEQKLKELNYTQTASLRSPPLPPSSDVRSSFDASSIGTSMAGPPVQSSGFQSLDALSKMESKANNGNNNNNDNNNNVNNANMNAARGPNNQLPATATSQDMQDGHAENAVNTEDVMKFKFQAVHLHPPAENYMKTVTTFSCTVHYPRQFRALRSRLYEQQEDKQAERNFIESLTRCQAWVSSGGKSGSPFARTLDERYVLKFVSQKEFKMFLDNAERYFEHMASVLFKSFPSVLVHILGVYQISWKTSTLKKNKNVKTDEISTQYVIVMPNLWYSKKVGRPFDLKGSVRGRYAESGASVLWDGNFIEIFQGFPLPLDDASKLHLYKAVHNDTLFLTDSEVVDYSLLVSINQSKNELVLGVIDYFRQYTWDKAAEEAVKSVGMAVGKAAPTIVKPSNYKQRFREAMEKYFMACPDRKTKRLAKSEQKSLKEAVRDIHILSDLVPSSEEIL